jgi:hypothetical protein
MTQHANRATGSLCGVMPGSTGRAAGSVGLKPDLQAPTSGSLSG